MENKTKNITIIILSVLLFVSFVFNIINFKPMMHSRMDNNMMRNQMRNRFDNMPNDRNHQRPDNQNQDNNQNDDNKTNENIE